MKKFSDVLAYMSQHNFTNNGKDIVVLLGATKSGKSSVTNLLLGNTLKYEGRGKIVTSQKKYNTEVRIGHGRLSETYLPQEYEFEGSIYADLPGFEDTRGADLEIENMFFTYKFFARANRFKLIFCIPEIHFVDADIKDMKKFFGLLKESFDPIPRIMLILTKISGGSIAENVCEINGRIKEIEKLDKDLSDFARRIIAESEKLIFKVPNARQEFSKDFIINEKGRNIGDVLKTLEAYNGRFKPSISQEARKFIDRNKTGFFDFAIKVCIQKSKEFFDNAASNSVGTSESHAQQIKYRSFLEESKESAKSFPQMGDTNTFEGFIKKYCENFRKKIEEHISCQEFVNIKDFFKKLDINDIDTYIKPAKSIMATYATKIVFENSFYRKISQYLGIQEVVPQEVLIKEAKQKTRESLKEIRVNISRFQEEENPGAQAYENLKGRLNQIAGDLKNGIVFKILNPIGLGDTYIDFHMWLNGRFEAHGNRVPNMEAREGFFDLETPTQEMLDDFWPDYSLWENQIAGNVQ